MYKLLDVISSSGVAFGTSGARGLVSAMSPEVCAAYTQAFVLTMQQAFAFKQVAIAIDLRPSSLRIADACANMLTQLGIDVVFCGEIPTPALALFAMQRQIPGIMVTGSHIPFDRNGLKFYRPDGEISKADEAIMFDCDVSSSPNLNLGASLPAEETSAKLAYQQRYKDFLGQQDLSGLRLALYQHSSVGRDLIYQLLTELGAEVVCVGRSDAFVPIDTEAVSEADVKRGLQWALDYGIDAIISTDGDADRPLLSDAQGRWLRGDIVGLLTARALNISHLAVPISCNTAIEGSGFFKTVCRTRIGSPYVIHGMQAMPTDGTARIAGFEANGGFLLGSHLADFPSLTPLPTRDALLPVIVLLAQVKTQNKPLSCMVSDLPSRFTASDRLQHFPSEKSLELITYWRSYPQQLLATFSLDDEIKSLDETDGLRVSLNSGNIMHFRPSGNAPEFRCYVEASTQEGADTFLMYIMTQLMTLNK